VHAGRSELSRNFVVYFDFRHDTITTGALCVIEATVATFNQRLGGFGQPKLCNAD
jgi:hypothetical protein